MSTGRQRHSHQYSEGNGSTEGDGPGGYQSLKEPPSMHLRDDMVKRSVKTTDGTKHWDCAMTWAEFEKKYSGQS